MAEGLLVSMAGELFEVYSAGTDPKGIHPGAVKAMQEIGIDISSQRSEHVDTYLGKGIDTVITVCDKAGKKCPIFPECTKVVHWSFDDPAEAEGTEQKQEAVFQRVRDEIAVAVKGWLENRPTA